MIDNNTRCLRRNKISTLQALSAIALVLMLAGLVLSLSNPLLLLQPVQAQTTMTFKTPEPATSEDGTLALTFDAQGTLSTNSSGYQPMNGTFQVNSSSNAKFSNSGDINLGRLSNNSQGVVSIEMAGRNIVMEASCSTSATNTIFVDDSVNEVVYLGAVDCNLGGDTTAQSSHSSSPMTGTTTTTQDSNRDSRDGDGDRDGIPDSSDMCTHNSNPRCFKEGGDTTSSTTTSTNQQQPQSSSNSTGNQTR